MPHFNEGPFTDGPDRIRRLRAMLRGEALPDRAPPTLRERFGARGDAREARPGMPVVGARRAPR